MAQGTIQDWTSGPPVLHPKDVGQQVVREVDDYFGDYLYLPRTVARIHLNAVYKELGGAEEAYPPTVSQDIAHMIQRGETGLHGGSGGFFALLKRGDCIIDPLLLVPFLTGMIGGASDLTAAGLLHSHWAPYKSHEPGFIGLSHWIWPGAYVLQAADAIGLLGDPNSDATKSTLLAIRRKITGA
jgi:hypothetical protein